MRLVSDRSLKIFVNLCEIWLGRSNVAREEKHSYRGGNIRELYFPSLRDSIRLSVLFKDEQFGIS